MKVHQLLATAHSGDATGDAALAVAAALRQAGHEAEIFALEVDPAMRGKVHRYSDFPPPEEHDCTVLHFNLPSPLTEDLVGFEGVRMLVYHNLTPPEQLLPYCPEIARLTALGRRQLEWLAAQGCVDLAIGVSAYNTRDLEAAGFSSTATVPLLVDLRHLRGPSNTVLEAELGRDSAHTFLTVGRVAPNKRIEDFLKAAAYYLRYVSPRARFLVVGGTQGMDPYLASLTKLQSQLELDARVRLVGRVSLEDLVTYYRAASVYVCTSTHEGFCAPLLEAMQFDLPIVARHAAAIPETLGNAGILVDTDDPADWAEMLHAVLEDEAMRERLSRSGQARLAAFDPVAVADRWVKTLTWS
jgi:glycosyltransferase involved in cell wall biosynthesis